MTYPQSTYDILSPEYRGLNNLFPQGMGILDLIGAATFGTSMDINPYLNIIRYNRQDRLFAQYDQRMLSSMLNTFRTQSFGDTTTGFDFAGRTIDQYLFDDKFRAESALRQAAIATGAGSYAFGSGGGSMADFYYGWDRQRGSYSDALTGLFSTIWSGPDDPNISRGMKASMLSGLLQVDPYIVRQYQQAREERGLENGEALDKFGDSLEKVNKALEGFGEAANSWGRILKTDAADAMQRLESLFGGVAYGNFYGNEKALANMAYDIKHVGGVTGRGADNTFAMIQQAGVILKQMGGHADAAVQAGTYAMMLSTGVAGYRTTQEEADKFALKLTTANQNSEQAALYFGGFAEWYRKKGNHMSMAAAQEQWDNMFKNQPITLQSVNAAIGENYTAGDFRVLSDLGIARDFQAGSNNFSMRAIQASRADLIDRIGANRQDNRFTAAGIDALSRRFGLDILKYTSEGSETRNSMLRDAGITNSRDIEYIDWIAKELETTANVLSRNNLWGIANGEDAQTVFRTISPTNIERTLVRDQQRSIRTKISGQTTGKDLVGLFGQFIRQNDNWSIGNMLSVLSGESLGGDGLSVAMKAFSTKEDRDKVFDAIKSLKSEEDIEAYSQLANRMLSKIGNKTFTAEDREFFREAIGIDYDTRSNQFRYFGSIDRSALDKQKTKSEKETQLQKDRREFIVDRMTENTVGNETVAAKTRAAGILAMSRLADERLELGGSAKQMKLAESFQNAVDIGKYEEAESMMQDMMKNGFGDKFAKYKEDIMSDMGLSKDAGVASAIASVFEGFMKTLTGVIKNEKVDVRVHYN